MKATELREKSKDELLIMLQDLSREYFSLRMQKSTGQLAKTDMIKKVKRNVARIFTVLSEKSRV